MSKKDISKKTGNKPHDYAVALQDLEHKIENMFQRFWKNPFNHEDVLDYFPSVSLIDTPKMDVIDKEKEIVVKAELPGIDKKDLDISISENRLVIKAKTCHEEKQEGDDYFKQEISKNEVYRSISLPAGVDDDSKIKTSFKNGILELNIPKRKESHRRRIEVE